MHCVTLWRMLAVALGVAGLVATPAEAVMVFDNTAGNTSTPVGDQGWQFVGQFAGGSGVAISSHHFISTQHQNGQVGNTFTLDGNAYTTTGYTNISNSDLRIWSVSSSLSTYASLFDGSLVGQDTTLVGYGIHTLGSEVTTTPPPTSHGWEWGGTSGKSWGHNAIDTQITSGGRHYLLMHFDPLTNEGTYGVRDSGGGVFIEDNGEWKLAGLNLAVQSLYAYEDDGSTFNAAIHNGTDLWWRDGAGNFHAASGPQQLQAANLVEYQSEIVSIIPEPASLLLLGAGGLMLLRRRPAARTAA